LNVRFLDNRCVLGDLGADKCPILLRRLRKRFEPQARECGAQFRKGKRAHDLNVETGHNRIGSSGGRDRGDAEIGFGGISKIMADSRVELLVGPLPVSIQNHMLFTAGIVASSKEQEIGKAFFSRLPRWR